MAQNEDSKVYSAACFHRLLLVCAFHRDRLSRVNSRVPGAYAGRRAWQARDLHSISSIQPWLAGWRPDCGSVLSCPALDEKAQREDLMPNPDGRRQIRPRHVSTGQVLKGAAERPAMPRILIARRLTFSRTRNDRGPAVTSSLPPFFRLPRHAGRSALPRSPGRRWRQTMTSCRP